MGFTKLKQKIEDIGTSLDPDGDWAPVLIVERQDNKMINCLLMMHNDETKDMCAKIMTKIIMETQPESATFISTGWLSKYNDRHEDKESFMNKLESGLIARPSEDPNRIECVICIVVEQSGKNAMIIGEIERSSTYPKIKKWTEVDEANSLDGRFAEAMREGFKRKEEYGGAKA